MIRLTEIGLSEGKRKASPSEQAMSHVFTHLAFNTIIDIVLYKFKLLKLHLKDYPPRNFIGALNIQVHVYICFYVSATNQVNMQTLCATVDL